MKWNTLAKRIAKNVKVFRKQKKLTQEAAADLSGGLSTRHWQYIEKGEINFTLQTLSKVAKALDVDPQKLISNLESNSG